MLTVVPQWVALYTNPRAEKRVELNLREAGFEAYLPLRRELHEWSDRKKWVETPLLKSYIFAKITKYQQVPICGVQGISHLIKFRGDVAVIPENEIQVMKDFLAAEVDMQVRSSEMLHRGKRVRIHSGSLAGKEGVLVSDCEDGNFAVEITGISMAMILYVDQDLLEAIDDNNEPEKPTKEYFF